MGPPQVGVPSPDGILGSGTNFTYQRLGVRIPTVVISPWIKKGTLVHDPSDGHKPHPTSQWELSSIVSSVQKALGLTGGPLTKRDAWAASFEYLWEADGAGTPAPRGDCPARLPDLPPPDLEAELARQTALPVDDTDDLVAQMLCDMNLGGSAADEADRAACVGGMPRTKGDAAVWAEEMTRRYLVA